MKNKNGKLTVFCILVLLIIGIGVYFYVTKFNGKENDYYNVKEGKYGTYYLTSNKLTKDKSEVKESDVIFSYNCESNECYVNYIDSLLAIKDNNKNYLYKYSNKKLNNISDKVKSIVISELKYDTLDLNLLALKYIDKDSNIISNTYYLEGNEWKPFFLDSGVGTTIGKYVLYVPGYYGNESMIDTNLLFLNRIDNLSQKKENYYDKTFDKLLIYDLNTSKIVSDINRDEIDKDLGTNHYNYMYEYISNMGDFYEISTGGDSEFIVRLLDKNYKPLETYLDGSGGPGPDIFFRLNKDGTMSCATTKHYRFAVLDKNGKEVDIGLKGYEVLTTFRSENDKYLYLVVAKNKTVYYFNVDTKEFTKLDIDYNSIVGEFSGGLLEVKKLTKKYNELDAKEEMTGFCQEYQNGQYVINYDCINKCNYGYEFTVDNNGKITIKNNYLCDEDTLAMKYWLNY